MDRRTFLRNLLLAGVAGAGLQWTGCAPPAKIDNESGPRLVFLNIPCTVSKRYLSPYNPAVDYTPNIRAFANEAMVFQRHQTEAGQTGVCYSSILSGNHSDQHGIYINTSSVDPSVYWMQEAFAQAGWDVHTFIDHSAVSCELNFGKGSPDGQCYKKTIEADARNIFRIIADRARKDPSYRALVITIYTKTHAPYAYGIRALTDEDFRKTPLSKSVIQQNIDLWWQAHMKGRLFRLRYDFDAYMENLGFNERQVADFITSLDLVYAKSMAVMDGYFGELIEEIKRAGLYDSSLILFSADHGETTTRPNAFFRFDHGFQLCPDSQGVPLIIRSPYHGIESGTIESVTRSVDLFPTLADLCGVPLRPDVRLMGVSLADALAGVTGMPQLTAFSHTAVIAASLFGTDNSDMRYFARFYPTVDPANMWAMSRAEDTVYKWAAVDKANPEVTKAVFDLAEDPHETSNLYDPQNQEHASQFNALGRYRRQLIDAYHIWEEKRENRLDPEEALKALRDLGYIS